MLKRYLIISYGVLVKAGRWSLEEVKDTTKPIVPEEYKLVVAEYLTKSK